MKTSKHDSLWFHQIFIFQVWDVGMLQQIENVLQGNLFGVFPKNVI